MLCDICQKEEAIGLLCQTCLEALMRYVKASNLTKPVINDESPDSKEPGLGGSKHGKSFKASASADIQQIGRSIPWDEFSFYGPYASRFLRKVYNENRP